MTRFRSTPGMLLIPLALLSGAIVTQADASWFHDPTTGVRRHIGSAPNPTPTDIITVRRGPDYPLQSRMFKEEGIVGLNLSLTETGKVSGALVERSSGHRRLDDAAVRFMKDRWHYKPVNKDLPTPMPKTVYAEVTFKLD